MNLVKVVIPIYKVDLSTLHMKILKHNLNILDKYTIVLACPINLDMSTLLFQLKPHKLQIERFDDLYFKGIEGYNRLMLSSLFYSRFLDTKYILICQTDAFVFRDELIFWCDKDYDYIGAPWIGSSDSLYNTVLRKTDDIIRRIKGKKARGWSHLFKVGNGGFSLRKVQSHFSIADKNSDLINECISSRNYHVEDVFWSMKAPLLDTSFIIPDYKEALSFAMDRKPKIAMALNSNKLPFGCHGYDKKRVDVFWKPIIDKFLLL